MPLPQTKTGNAPLRIYAKVPGTETLGPFLRYGLWVQGCPFSCAGCMTPDAHAQSGGELWSAEDLAADVLAESDIEGITISGGEPFAQATGLSAMLHLIREARDLGVIIYTGFRLESLQKLACSDSGVAELLGVADLIIDGPYEESLNHDVSLKGSSNQRAHLVSSRYRDYLYLYDLEQARRVEVQIRLDERMFIGIPSRRQLMWWQKEKGV
ncbi:anaerobic ribonucleoside-triphosphate reductase-activating protein [Betaproteobacteria bacterium]|nr:anaerobic ribonucleoside-triphosphate reductase-activating protein [Betaproteobacteria bacterium]